MRTFRLLLLLLLPALTVSCRSEKPLLLPGPAFGAPVTVNDRKTLGQSEPHISVSPDGREVAVAWIDWNGSRPTVRLALSSNGGASFAASIPAHEPDPDHSDGQADPALVHDAHGNLHLAWLGCGGDPAAPTRRGCDVMHRVRKAGAWTEPARVAAGDARLRGRPWLLSPESALHADSAPAPVYVSWYDEGADGATWSLAVTTSGLPGTHTPLATLRARTGIQPVFEVRGGLETLLLDRENRDPIVNVLVRVRSTDGGKTFEELGKIRYERQAVLLDYSTGAFASQDDGEAWIAFPRGSGLRNDFLLAWRGPMLDALDTVGPVRAASEGRVGMPWIEPLPDGRFLMAWLEDSPGHGGEGWRVMARILGPGKVLSQAVDVSGPFAILPASLDRNIGDFLTATQAGGRVWLAWSDTRNGDADIRVASAPLP